MRRKSNKKEKLREIKSHISLVESSIKAVKEMLKKHPNDSSLLSYLTNDMKYLDMLIREKKEITSFLEDAQ